MADYVTRFLAARKEVAEELGEDPDTFDLNAHLAQEAEREDADSEGQEDHQGRAEREADVVALENPTETRNATFAIATKLAELRGVSWEDMKPELLSVYDHYDGNLDRILKRFESELAKEMAAASPIPPSAEFPANN